MGTVTKLHRPEDLKGQVAAEIRSRMARYGINQTAMGRLVGINQSQLSKRLRGIIAFDVDELERIADVLETSPATLLGGKEETPRPDGPGGLPVERTRRYSKPQPSDPNVRGSGFRPAALADAA